MQRGQRRGRRTHSASSSDGRIAAESPTARRRETTATDWVGTTRDVPSFTIEALPAEAFEALLVATAELGEVEDDDPPYELRTLLCAAARLLVSARRGPRRRRVDGQRVDRSRRGPSTAAARRRAQRVHHRAQRDSTGRASSDLGARRSCLRRGGHEPRARARRRREGRRSGCGHRRRRPVATRRTAHGRSGRRRR